MAGNHVDDWVQEQTLSEKKKKARENTFVTS